MTWLVGGSSCAKCRPMLSESDALPKQHEPPKQPINLLSQRSLSLPFKSPLNILASSTCSHHMDAMIWNVIKSPPCLPACLLCKHGLDQCSSTSLGLDPFPNRSRPVPDRCNRRRARSRSAFSRSACWRSRSNSSRETIVDSGKFRPFRQLEPCESILYD